MKSASEDQEKLLLRKLILEKRRALSDDDRREKSLAIERRLLTLEGCTRAQLIHLFLSFKGEVITDGIVKSILSSGKRVVVPVVKQETGELILSELRNYPEEVAPGAFGIPEPKKEFIRSMDPASVDVFVLPGVAFDLRGHRLGYGAGYYDRILGRTSASRMPGIVLMIGLAFEVQIVDQIPASVHDVRVHKIVTEERVIDCSHSEEKNS